MNHLQRKYYTTVLAVCMLALAVSGCGYGNGNYHQLTAVDRVLTQDNTGISSKHERLDGTEEYTIHVPDGKTYAVLINILNQEGSLSITIGKNGDTPVYTGNDVESSTFTVYLRETGDYKVVITANKHKGSYSLDWS